MADSSYDDKLRTAQTAKDTYTKNLISQIFNKPQNNSRQYTLDNLKKPNYGEGIQKMAVANPLNLSAYHRKIQYQNGSGQYRVLYGN